MDTESTSGVTVVNSRVIGSTVSSMVSEFISRKVVPLRKVNGKKENDFTQPLWLQTTLMVVVPKKQRPQTQTEETPFYIL